MPTEKTEMDVHLQNRHSLNLDVEIQRLDSDEILPFQAFLDNRAMHSFVHL